MPLHTTQNTVKYDIYRGLDENFGSYVQKRFKNAHQSINDIVSPIKISRYEKKPKYTYFALLVPEYGPDENIVWKQAHAFIGSKYVLFVDEDMWTEFDNFEKSNKWITKETTGIGLFYSFTINAIGNMFNILAQLQLRIETMERSIFRNIPNNDQIYEIQNLKKNIINFKSTLVPIYEVLSDYRDDTKISTEEKRSIEDMLRKVKKLMSNLDDFHDITKLLRETNETLIARSTNETIKRLTLFNALLLGPSMIAAFFGMNIHFGWFTENASHGEITPLFGIICIMIFMTCSVYIFFKKRNWI